MNRINRAAGFAVAVVALTAATTFSAPSLAESTPTSISAPARQAGPAAVDAALDRLDAEVAPAAAQPRSSNLFSMLWTKASALFGSDDAVTTVAPAPEAPRTLDELVLAYAGDRAEGDEQDCLAKAVYFEARGETVEGQLAVAEVVMNRAASGRYPDSWCKVITQPWQFSFIDHGRFPTPDFGSEAWRKAVAIARIAQGKLADTLPSDVLWYHATYVSPSWGRRLTRTAQIGLHIFYS